MPLRYSISPIEKGLILAQAIVKEAGRAESEHDVIRHYREVKKHLHGFLENNKLLTTGFLTDDLLTDTIAVLQELARILDHWGGKSREKAEKCRQEAETLRRELEKGQFLFASSPDLTNEMFSSSHPKTSPLYNLHNWSKESIEERSPLTQVFNVITTRNEDLGTFGMETHFNRSIEKDVILWKDVLEYHRDALFLEDSDGHPVDFLKDQNQEPLLPLRLEHRTCPLYLVVYDRHIAGASSSSQPAAPTSQGQRIEPLRHPTVKTHTERQSKEVVFRMRSSLSSEISSSTLSKTGVSPSSLMPKTLATVVHDDSSSRYLRDGHPFAVGGVSLIYRCRRIPEQANTPVENHEFPLALKLIPRSFLPSISETPVEVQKTAERFGRGPIDINTEQEKYLKDMLQEVTYLHTLCHPRILRFVEFYLTAEHVNFVMELALGGDLQLRMEARRNMNSIAHYEEEELVPIIRIVCNTLCCVHAAGWIHRDLKPSKIMFRTQKNDDVAIAGFGFAMFQDAIDDKETVFATTDLGSNEFMAPERLNNLGYGAPVDMWALGATCFYLLTGQYPFGIGGVAYSDGPSIVDGLQWDNFGFSAFAKDFIQNLLVWNPEKRLTSFEAEIHPWLSIHININQVYSNRSQ